MTFGGRKALTLLFVGDVAIFALSLWLTLAVRYVALPPPSLFRLYALPFSILFAIWILVFFVSGLYGKSFILYRSRVPREIFRTQLFNILAAALLFFLVPEFGITPKTVLVIYLCISLALIYFWRLVLFPRITVPIARERAALIGAGPEVDALVAEVNNNPRYHLEFKAVVDPQTLSKDTYEEFKRRLEQEKISLIVVDADHEASADVPPLIYDLAFVQQKFQYANFYRIYEEVFDRVPLSLLRYDWFLENISRNTMPFYNLMKRCVDLLGGVVMGLVTGILIPFVFIAMRFEGPGPLFITQARLGINGQRTRVYKFRSMSFNESASGAWVGESRNAVTRVGNFLRRTSLDEFPQFLNVLKGDLSLIGPRNDIEGLGLRLAGAVPYYNIRYVVKPGITGWAQINQQYEQGNISPQSIEETKVRLAYDFYYIKNRSFTLDIVIALKTLKRLFFRVSSW